MLLKKVELSNFRSYYKKDTFRFSPKITVILGPNAAGKTNLLESVFFLSTGKSFRADTDKEMIGFDKEMARVAGEISQLSNNPINNVNLEIIITNGEVMGIKTPNKRYSINGVGKRMLDFVGTLKTVLFWPEDLELVTDSPGRRRRYLDFVLVQIDREYRRSLISYEKGIRNRNKILEAIRDTGAHRSELIFWDQLLISTGQYITTKREEYITFLNNFKIQSSNVKSNPKSQIPIFNIEYDKSEISEARLLQYREEEVGAGVTLVGPHRDDLIFEIGSDKRYEIKDKREKSDSHSSLISYPLSSYRNLSLYGSRGEQRLGILWLKIGELSYIETVSEEKPVLILDDIFSELDKSHREIVFEIIGGHQTIMSTTDLHHIDKNVLEEVEVIKL